ncbi:hypothetical protein [Metabacillus fastidiosus]|uniref:hypothetical protein n=1 Tax=Metabacillus fastidiosus TaxID=1458 RepID=UPI003D26A8B9
MEKEIQWLKEADSTAFQDLGRGFKRYYQGEKGNRNTKAKRMRFGFLHLDVIMRNQSDPNRKQQFSPFMRC